MISLQTYDSQQSDSLSSPRQKLVLHRLGFPNPDQVDYQKYHTEIHIYDALNCIDQYENEFCCEVSKHIYEIYFVDDNTSKEDINSLVDHSSLINISNQEQAKKLNKQRADQIYNLKQAFKDLFLRIKDLKIKMQLTTEVQELEKTIKLKIITACKYIKQADEIFLLEVKRQMAEIKSTSSNMFNYIQILQNHYNSNQSLLSFVEPSLQGLLDKVKQQKLNDIKQLELMDKTELQRISKFQNRIKSIHNSSLIQQPIKWQTSMRYTLKPCEQLFSDEELRAKQVHKLQKIQKTSFQNSLKDLQMGLLWPSQTLQSSGEISQIQEKIFLLSKMSRSLDVDSTLKSLEKTYKSQFILDDKTQKLEEIQRKIDNLQQKITENEKLRQNFLAGSTQNHETLHRFYAQERIVEKKQLEKLNSIYLKTKLQ